MVMKPIFDTTGARVYHYKRTTASKPERDDPEFRLQRQCAEYLAAYLSDGVPWGATLNGVYLTPKTRTKAQQTGFRRGPLDLFVVWNKRTLWAEAKIRPNKMTPEQRAFAAALDPADWFLFYDFDEFVNGIKAWGLPMRAHSLT